MRAEIIAEIGQNHNGDLGLAKEMIWAAKEAGADTAKFQLYETAKIFKQSPDYKWYDYNCKTELPKKWLPKLKIECDKAGIEFMASVFDVERVDWLEEIDVKRYKIASRSVKDRELMKRIYSTNKPVIISLGMWDSKKFPSVPAKSRTKFLYCVSKYPTPFEDIYFDKIDFKKYDGFSDHTIGISASIAAIAMGAGIIEKHLTMNKKMYGPDHICSGTPKELKEICKFRDDFEKMS